jgi:AbrB family looped-hinge helix DNA binding protein
MTMAVVSDKGQITLPAKLRKQLGIAPRSKLDVAIEGDRIVMQPIKSVMELSGILRERAKGKPTDWETIQQETMDAVPKEVANEDRD